VDVFERSATALEGRGAGIVVLPATERYFLERAVATHRVSLELSHWTYVDNSGRRVSARPDPFHFSGWNTLYRGLLGELDPDRYHLDSEMVGFEQTPRGVRLHLSGGRLVEGDLLVCADGSGSTARRILVPDATPTFAGYVAWRGVTEEAKLGEAARELLADAMVYQVLDHSHFLVYAIPAADGSVVPGERLINFVWYRNYPLGGPFEDLMTDTEGTLRPSTVPPGFVRVEPLAEMHGTARRLLAPVLAEVVDLADEILIQAIFDLQSPRMAFGRVALIGDAAFVVRPHLAAGQAKACADAWALAEALEASDGAVESALARWEPGQLALGMEVVALSRDMGRRSQVTGEMWAGDPDWRFGLGKAS
jgi:2,6-dihydroxypyridine 3-monooxygenase